MYNITVLTQPTNPSQTCVVTLGSGTISGNVTNVSVACRASATTPLTWTLNNVSLSQEQISDGSFVSVSGGVTGSFTYDADQNTISSWSFTISSHCAGCAQPFVGDFNFTFTQQNSYLVEEVANGPQFFSAIFYLNGTSSTNPNNLLALYLMFQPLTDAGGTAPIDEQIQATMDVPAGTTFSRYIVVGFTGNLTAAKP